MSDGLPERRRDSAEIRDRLTRVETLVEALPKMREDMTRAHQEQSGKIDAVHERLGKAMLSNSSTMATLGTTMAAHIEVCKNDKAAQAERDLATQSAIDDLQKRLWLAAGIATALGVLVPYLLKIRS